METNNICCVRKKSCCRKNQILKITSLLSGLPIVFDDGEWVNFRLFFGVLLLFMLRDITLYKTCRKNKIGALKVQITNVLMKIMRNGGRDASIGVRRAKKSENGGGMNRNFFFSRCFKISWYHWIALDEIYSNLPLLPSLRFCSPVCLALISEFFLFLLVFPY